MSKFRRGTDVGLEYIFTPIVLVLLVITVVSVIVGIKQAKQIMPEGQVPTGAKRAPMVFLLVLLAYFTISFFDAYGIRMATDRIFPVTISSVGIIATLLVMIRMIRSNEGDDVFADRESSGEDRDAPHGLWPTLAWFGALLVLAALFGFIIALAIFLMTFLLVRARVSIVYALIYTACGIYFMCLMADVLGRSFPPGLLQSYVEMGWPLGDGEKLFDPSAPFEYVLGKLGVAGK